MDELKEKLNRYLFFEYSEYEAEPESKVSSTWPYQLSYCGRWAIPNANDAGDFVDVFLLHEDGKNPNSNPDLYVYATRHAFGADEKKNRNLEQYVQEEWDVPPQRLLSDDLAA